MSSELIKRIFSLREQNNPLIAVESPLQERISLLENLTKECINLGINCYIWMLEDDKLYQLTISDWGLAFSEIKEYNRIAFKVVREDSFEILRFWKTTQLQGILILEGIYPWLGQGATDADSFLTAEWIKSALINIKLYNHNSCKTALLLGSNASLKSDIAGLIPIITQELPTVEEISDYLPQILPDSITLAQINEIANTCVGMYLADIETGVKTALAIDNSELIKKVSAYKIELLKRVYNVEFLQPMTIPVGGLELMQSAFKGYRRLLTPLAKSYNLRLPKGVLLIGPPGTGKSHSAKACSQILELPLVIVEWGHFRSYGNMAEYKLKKLLALVDRINRIIFYLDDFDKGFAGDDDLSRRLGGMLLTWMQERTSDVLIIASANNIQWLPPELTRSGRFDQIFKIDLPNNGERHSIFKIHLARFDKRFADDGDAFTPEEWQRLLKITHRCVGAEIQAIVERAAFSIFCQSFDEETPALEDLPPLQITLTALLESRKSVNPLAIREADRIESMRNKADLQGLPSSPVDSSIYSLGDIDIFGS
ncbi:ATP-binding protein [Nostoc sp. XA010]|uniref:ATP-binding protein n=1 Tax=Nostoc sp. XA010 TaxID=2780407 RepID=UPI001E2E4404|nr:ATP-binding protein [Nostoc sp. XA010]MCC5659115.1 ATP-binding protein [Nostoc sp. XA010]